MAEYPKNYLVFQKRFPKLIKLHEEMGRVARKAGVLDDKTGNLIQLAACAALSSEGGVHSHTRRAIKAGATKEEIYQAVALLVNTIGFPKAAAAFSWVNDVAAKK